MSNSKFSSRYIVGLFCAAVLTLLSMSTVLAREGDTHQATIDELLKLDSQAALLAAKKNIFGLTHHAHASTGTDAHSPERNQVLAIYGIGKVLTAEVLLDSEPHVFKNARARPVWGPSLLYKLERIVPPCVYFKKLGQAHVVCLRK